MGFGEKGRDLFPFGKQRRKELSEISKIDISQNQSSEERNRPHWSFNSPLTKEKNDDFLGSFEQTFSKVLPSGENNFRGYIEKNIISLNRKGEALGLELGGQGSKVFGGFSEGLFKKSVGIALVDHRHILDKRDDTRRHHTVITENILSPNLDTVISEWSEGEGVDVIFERMMGGLEINPVQDPFIASQAFQKWYSWAREGSMMFLQVPVVLNPLMPEWRSLVRDASNGCVTTEFHPGHMDGFVDSGSTLHIHKLPGAPKELPMLDVRTVRRISREG